MTTAAFQPIPTNDARLVSVATLVLWLTVLAIALIGVIIPYVRPTVPMPNEIQIVAETLNVELTTDPIAQPDLQAPRAAEPPPLENLLPQPVEAPALTAVAEPTQVAFALPVEGPVRIVEAKQAAYSAPVTPVQAAPPQPRAVPQQITFGEGEGRQPAPEYPYRARREGQEGVVKVRFSVGENGQVIAAESSTPSPWPMLNEAAVRVVRERWRFRAGILRLYEVSIRFQLTR